MLDHHDDGLQPNHLDKNYPPSSNGTVTSSHKPTFGHQDTYGETDVNQVNIKG